MFLAKRRSLSYSARIVFRNGRIYLHLFVPLELFLKYFSKGRAEGSLIAGFDLNSDRINMVIIDRYGRMRDIKTGWFSEVTSQGFPRSKAKTRRLETLAELLRYTYHHNVGTIVFENLLAMRQRKYRRNPTANGRIAKFAKRELLQYGIVMALKYGFKVLLVNPKGVTHSKEHDEIM